MRIFERIMVGGLVLLVAYLLITPIAKSIGDSFNNSAALIANPTNH